MGVLQSRLGRDYPAEPAEKQIRDAMNLPVDSPRLEELAKGKKNIVILASDHTRPVPSKLILPPMLRAIREGNPESDITILIATGCHRGTTQEELEAKFGPEIAKKERIIVHDCDLSEMTELGTLPSGQKLLVNKLAAEADLLVAEGFIEPHFFAGFSGGRKSVLPGIAARKAVLGNHNGAFIADPCSRTGILKGNRIHEDMVFAAKAAGLAFIVNIVLNAEHEVVCAVAGDPVKAHEKGCDFLRKYCTVKLPSARSGGSSGGGIFENREQSCSRPQGNDSAFADIVITSNGGYPLDQNVYQAVKGMTGAEAAVRQDGVIIMASECGDGCGGEVFYRTFRDHKDPAALMEAFAATPAEETIVDQWQSQIFARVLKRARIVFISEMPDEIVRDFHMIPAHSLEEALRIADSLTGNFDGSITVIPDGVGVIVET